MCDYRNLRMLCHCPQSFQDGNLQVRMATIKKAINNQEGRLDTRMMARVDSSEFKQYSRLLPPAEPFNSGRPDRSTINVHYPINARAMDFDLFH